ncbi:BPI fold-containing family A member 2 [Tamandua tetradactyla]|uniref:BPI fold-containing family A member 2 n=1 Tax=Tamandua tetradactyla TaxID=48850 RepID=UPI004054489B
MVESDISKMVSTLEKSLGLELGNSSILEFKSEVASDGKGINLKIPVSTDVALHLPFLGDVIHLKVSMEILTGVRLETDKQTGIPSVVLLECATDPASVHLTVLDITSGVIQRVVDSLTNILNKTVSFLVQKAVCPMIQHLLHTLDVDFIQNLIKRLQDGIHLKITV